MTNGYGEAPDGQAEPERASAEDELLGELRRTRASGRRIPEFFVVGHAKCGTTAMFQMLRAHPRVYLPAIKETQFLARDLDAGTPRSGRRSGAPQLRPETLDAYLALFEDVPKDLLAGEISTAYLRTPATAGRIAALAPDARIVAILREPASFVRSLHLQLLQVGAEQEADLAQAIALEQDRRLGRGHPPNGAWPTALQYTQHVRYVQQLRAYHELFGRERVLVLIYDDFRRDNRGVMRALLRFLEVDDSLEIAATQANPTVRVRSHRAQELLHDLSVGRGPVSRIAKRTVKALTPKRLRRGALHAAQGAVVDRRPAPTDERLMRELRVRFKPEVLAASEYLQRDLVGLWGYDEID